jgi:hypothetical protein
MAKKATKSRIQQRAQRKNEATLGQIITAQQDRLSKAKNTRQRQRILHEIAEENGLQRGRNNRGTVRAALRANAHATVVQPLDTPDNVCAAILEVVHSARIRTTQKMRAAGEDKTLLRQVRQRHHTDLVAALRGFRGPLHVNPAHIERRAAHIQQVLLEVRVLWCVCVSVFIFGVLVVLLVPSSN